jgi:hypothetical protein
MNDKTNIASMQYPAIERLANGPSMPSETDFQKKLIKNSLEIGASNF